MMLRVSSLQKATPTRYAIRGNLGKRSIEAVILYSKDGELEGFNIDGDVLRLLLYFGGLEGAFSRMFFQHRKTGEPSLPWEVGEIDDEALERVSKAVNWQTAV